MRRASVLLPILVASLARGQTTVPAMLAPTGGLPAIAALTGDRRGADLPSDAPTLDRLDDAALTASTVARPRPLEHPDRPIAQAAAPASPGSTTEEPSKTSAPATPGVTGEPATPHASSAPTAPAQPTWPAHGVPPVGTWDIVATGALGVALLAVQFGVSAPSQPKWTTQNGFDTGARDLLRIGGEGGRAAAATTSDVLVYILMAAPFLNATLVAGVEHERWDVGWRLLVLDAQTLLLATTITLTLQKTVARERPFVQECRTNPNLKDCSLGGQNQSFPSGHTTAAFAAVALECFHHGYLDTSHTGWGAAVCPVTVVAAIGTGILRIAADRHWATDILVGAAIGGLVGYAVPALHLLGQEKKDALVLTPTLSQTTMGVTLAGRW